MDKLVPSIDSNFSDIVLCYWLNYNFFTALKLNVIEPFFSFSNMNE